MRNVVGLIISFLYIGLIIMSAKFFEKSGKEASRKYIHILLSNWWIIAMVFFENWIWASILPVIFIVVNYLSYKKDLIAVMERETPDGMGTVYYAISLLVVAILTFGVANNPSIGLASILVMGYGDGLAAIVGRSIKSKEYHVGKVTKTVAGSATMLVVSFIILSVFLVSVQSNLWYLKALLYSILITILEGISMKGTDNLTVPIVTCLLLMVTI